MIFLKAYFLIGAFIVLITTYYTQHEIIEKTPPEVKESMIKHPSRLVLAIFLTIIIWPTSLRYLIYKLFTSKKK